MKSILTGLLVTLVTLIGIMGLYTQKVSYANPIQESPEEQVGELPPEITTESGDAEIALAQYLQGIDAKLYTLYTCPHCHHQKQLFGQKASKYINNIECHPQGQNSQTQLCRDAGIQGVPTWEINGELYVGVHPLNDLADLAGYSGSRQFKYQFIF